MTLHSISDIQLAATAYSTELAIFLRDKGFTKDMYRLPIDHVAIKTANREVYEATMQTLAPLATDGCIAHLNSRRIATIQLLEAFDLGPLGQTPWLEIMEPRPEKVGQDYVGFEHAELIIKDESALKACFEAAGLVPEVCQNTYHTAYALKINSAGQEIKFTNNPLYQVVSDELESGTAVAINT